MPIRSARPKTLTPAALSSPGGAKSGEQILKIAQIHLAVRLIFPALRTFGLAAVIPAWRPFGAALIDFTPIIAGALVRVREQIISRRDRFETRFRLRLTRVQIRMKLLGELTIRLAYIIGAGVRFDTEHLIGCFSRRHSDSTLPQRPLPLRRRRGLLDADGHGAFDATSFDRQLDLVADPRKANAIAQFGPAAHWGTIDRDDEVIGSQAGTLGGRPRLDTGDHCAFRVPRPERLCQVRGQILDRDADPPAFDLAITNELVHDLPGH